MIGTVDTYFTLRGERGSSYGKFIAPKAPEIRSQPEKKGSVKTIKASGAENKNHEPTKYHKTRGPDRRNTKPHSTRPAKTRANEDGA